MQINALVRPLAVSGTSNISREGAQIVVTLASEMNDPLQPPIPRGEAERRSLHAYHTAAIAALNTALEVLERIKPELGAYPEEELQKALAHHVRRVVVVERVRAEIASLTAML